MRSPARKRGKLERGSAGLELAALIPLVVTLVTGITLAATYIYQRTAIITAVGDCATVYSAMGPADAGSARSQEVLVSTLNGFGLGDAEYRRSIEAATNAVCQADFRQDFPVPWNVQPWYEVQYTSTYLMQCYRSDWDGGLSVSVDVNTGCTGGRR